MDYVNGGGLHHIRGLSGGKEVGSFHLLSCLLYTSIRAPKATWGQLDDTTKERYIECFKKVRVIRPAYNNWLLFRDRVEAFLLSVGEEPDGYADVYKRQIQDCFFFPKQFVLLLFTGRMVKSG